MENILHSRSGIAIKAALFIIIIGMLSSSSLKAQQCNCDHVISPPEVRATSVFVDGDKLHVKPGQTICLKSGFYMQIRFVRIFGEPGKPVTIINCGGPVQIGDSTTYGQWYAADIVNCKYIRLTGSGNNEYKYGITLGKSGDSGLKIGGLSTDTEIDHVEIANTGFAGILAKTDFGGRPPVDAPEMNNVNIHDTYIHDTQGEGLYVGETKTPGQNFRHLRIWNNIVARTGFELIQLANCVEDARVHNNVLYRGGVRNVLYQNKGVQIGDNTVGAYYDNFVIESGSNSMIIMGSGDINVFHNYLQGAGDPAFFIDNRSVTIDMPIHIYDNFIKAVRQTAPFISISNEVNRIDISGNHLDGQNTLISYGSGAGQNVTLDANILETITDVQFADTARDNFSLPLNSIYRGIGPLEDYGNLNTQPVIRLIGDQEIVAGAFETFKVVAKDPDGDQIHLEAFNLPSFALFRDAGNGHGVFYLAPVAADTGVYYKLRIRATDSRGEMNTQSFAVTVTDPGGSQVRSADASTSNNATEPDPAFHTGSGIFPNPATGRTTIALPEGPHAAVMIRITDQVGQVRYMNNLGNTGQFIDLDLDERAVPPGLYVLTIKVDEQPVEMIRLVRE